MACVGLVMHKPNYDEILAARRVEEERLKARRKRLAELSRQGLEDDIYYRGYNRGLIEGFFVGLVCALLGMWFVFH